MADNMSSFTVVIDSNCDLPPGYVVEHDVEVMPMQFELDGTRHDQGYWQEISGKDFYNALRNGGVATTSQINPETFVAYFTEYAKQGKSAVFLLLSSGLSNTLNSAQIALHEIKEVYPDCDLYIIDTISAGVGHGLLAMMAVKMRDEGLSACETAKRLEEKKHKCIGLFSVDDLMYLHRGGRLSRLSAVAGSILGVKPLLNLAPDGTLSLKDKARKKKGAINMMVSQMKRSIDPDTTLDTVMVSHTDCHEDAQILVNVVKESVKVREVNNILMGPVIGAHLGPGSLILVFESNMTRAEYEARFYGSKP